jgi:hypothetical protein
MRVLGARISLAPPKAAWRIGLATRSKAALRGILLSLGVAATLLVLPVRTDEPKTFGAGVSMTEVTSIARLVKDPAAFEGKTVRVEGTVKAVCQHMGCWMALASADAADAPTLRLKVDDGVIVFPVTAKGHRAAAQGVVERVADAEGKEAAGEHAKAEGKAKDTAAQWHIKATGAIVY